MSRLDADTVLQVLGFVPDHDYIVSAESATSVNIVWYAQSPQPTEAELNAVTQAQIDAWRTQQLRNLALAIINDANDRGKQVRAVVSILIDEINTLRTEINLLRSDVRAAAPTIPARTLNARTLAQAKTAYQNTINAGTVD